MRKKQDSLFFTGTDTGVGKTSVACEFARAWMKEGREVCAMKAVACGGKMNSRREFLCEDSAMLAKASTAEGIAVYEQVTGLRLESPLVGFSKPIAPVSAARMDNETLDYGALIRTLKALKSECEKRNVSLIVEGAGGALVPLSRTKTIADVIAALGMAAVVVARTELGTINHTLMTLESLAARGVKVKSLVFKRMKQGALTLVEEASIDELLSMTPRSLDVQIVPFRKELKARRAQGKAGV